MYFHLIVYYFNKFLTKWHLRSSYKLQTPDIWFMHKKWVILLVYCSVLSLFAVSCRKSDYKASALVNATDKTQLNTIFQSLRSIPQVVTVTAGVYTEFRLAQGTKFRFYPHSFKDKNGQTISSGVVTLSIIEMYTAGQALANRSVSITGNLILKNQGDIYITASMNGEEIFVNKYGIDFFSATHAEVPMGLYYGNVANDDSLVNWTRVGTMTGTVVTGTVLDTMSVFVVDSAGTGVDTMKLLRNYYQFDSCSSLYWVGCHYPFSTTNARTNIEVKLTDNAYNGTNTQVFLVYPDINAALPVNIYNATTHTFSFQQGYEVPVGQRTDIVVISYAGGNYYFFVQKNVDLSVTTTFKPFMSAYTPNEIINLLSLL